MAISSNQLRIGNWVKRNADLNGAPDLGRITQVHIDGYSVDYHWPGSWYSPIPLTPEILIACGFQRHINSNDFWEHFVLGNGWYISKSNHDEDSAGVIKDRFYWGDNYHEVKTLHQLQNLYFALTNTEIKYTGQ
jgi:hypothetical protein